MGLGFHNSVASSVKIDSQLSDYFNLCSSRPGAVHVDLRWKLVLPSDRR